MHRIKAWLWIKEQKELDEKSLYLNTHLQHWSLAVEIPSLISCWRQGCKPGCTKEELRQTWVFCCYGAGNKQPFLGQSLKYQWSSLANTQSCNLWIVCIPLYFNYPVFPQLKHCFPCGDGASFLIGFSCSRCEQSVNQKPAVYHQLFFLRT